MEIVCNIDMCERIKDDYRTNYYCYYKKEKRDAKEK